MDTNEKRLLDVVTLSTIVIALSSFGLLSLEIVNTFNYFLIPMWVRHIFLSVLSVLTLYYALISVIKYQMKK
jgi:hypothetical protein